ncbi:MAG TPA: VIT and VWA domain-containing protein [Fimbriimonadaceae bacterium]|nr:VIT and VWA domain-containing protein [Fimbriimonadaceae bacterium]HRJ32292.1 VIT and VWA domain-containing protein [Fimbriimonadaceae bacterium]
MLHVLPILAVVFGPPHEMVGAGDLVCRTPDGKLGLICPLESTRVNADIAGFGARVTLVQTFSNPSPTPIEAIYTFPLPPDAAVDRMRIRIGDRIIEATIRRREEARQVYEDAKRRGQSAALLDQERPNIFTQSIANLMPGKKIEVEISYVQLLKYDEGSFTFSYPMVVGPRFVANAEDPNKISPPTLPPNVRSGAQIEMTVNIDAGAPMTGLESVLHEVDIRRQGPSQARVTLKKRDEIPNRDFILRMGMAEGAVKTAFLTHAQKEKGGFFTLLMLPPKAPQPSQISPREMIFVMDQSGSQSGFPIEKSKELSEKIVKALRPQDTFNVMGFSNDVRWLWPFPRPVNEPNIEQATRFIRGLQANGGTQLYKAITAALAPAPDRTRPRYVVFNTDGFIGDEVSVLKAIQRGRANSRVFTFGIGNGVNTYLIDSMSAEGKGASEIVTLQEAADSAVDRFLRRIDAPVLTHIEAEIEGEGVSDVLPDQIPDVFSHSPVILKGRYSKSGPAQITIRGKLGGQPWSTTLNVNLPAEDRSGNAIASLWARAKLDALERQGWMAEREGQPGASKEAMTELALEFGLMSAYTSFVAVEERIVNVGGKQRRVAVPVEMTDGVTLGTRDEAGRAPGSPGGGGRGGSMGGLRTTGAAMPAAKSLNQSGVWSDEAAPKTPAEKEKRDAETVKKKVSAELLASKATRLEVQVWVQDLSPETIKKLEKLGFKVEARDDQLRILFGQVDRARLKALALEAVVEKIKPL